MGAFGELGSQTRRRHPDRAPPNAADGAFLPDPLPQVLDVFVSVRNLGKRGPFSPHAHETSSSFGVCAYRHHWFSDGAGSARAGNAAGSNRAAYVREKLHTDASGA